MYKIQRLYFHGGRRAPALAEYQRVTAPALAEYHRVRAAAWAEYVRVRTIANELGV